MSGRLLLVEDSPTDEKLAVRAFAKCGVGPDRLTVVRDGAEALDWLFLAGAHADRPPGNPAVVLLDLKLPRIDGLEVLRQVRADDRTRLVPIVVLTASIEEEDLLRSYRLGANAYVRKPVDFTAFAETAARIAWFWLLANESPPQR